jgi:hypothetical protein
MARLCEVVLLLILLWLLMGCGECRPPIIDIRDQPQINLGGWTIEGIETFHGYDSQFKFDNQLLTAQGRLSEVWWPFWGAKR